uniref:hypothetical protein n=1 Tax=Nonomuraea pusilla TaxID=46177 RepID=UPI0006E2D3A0|nr:hypothetical protein [Nonomuraea pusilla]
MSGGQDALAGLQQYQAGGLGQTRSIEFAHGKIKDLGVQLGEHAPNFGTMAANTKGIDIEFPGFGVIGLSLAYVHAQAKESAGKALETARTVLEDYQTALAKLDKNYTDADKDNDGVIQATMGGGGGGGGLKPGDFPGGGGGGLPPMGGPKTDLPSTDLPKTDLPKTDLPKTDLPSTDLPKTDLPSTDLPKTDLPKTDLPKTDLPSTDLPKTDLPKTDLPQTPSIADKLNGIPDPNASSYDPSKTKLSSVDPPKITVPDATTSIPPGASPSTGLTPGGGPASGYPSGQAAGLRGQNGAGGFGGMPYAPMMGGAGAGEQERERDKKSIVSGDESDWLDSDIDITPAVLGE